MNRLLGIISINYIAYGRWFKFSERAHLRRRLVMMRTNEKMVGHLEEMLQWVVAVGN